MAFHSYDSEYLVGALDAICTEIDKKIPQDTRMKKFQTMEVDMINEFIKLNGNMKDAIYTLVLRSDTN